MGGGGFDQTGKKMECSGTSLTWMWRRRRRGVNRVVRCIAPVVAGGGTGGGAGHAVIIERCPRDIEPNGRTGGGRTARRSFVKLHSSLRCSPLSLSLSFSCLDCCPEAAGRNSKMEKAI